MMPTVRYAVWTTGIAVATLLVPAPAAAVTNRPPRDETSRSQVVIQRVEVPVPVLIDDTANDAVRMTIAATLGAAIGAVGRTRRSRHRPTRTGAGIIDITDTVRL